MEHSTELPAKVVDRLDNETVINISPDLAKAFDTIDDKILVTKLEYYRLEDTP